MFGTIRPLSRVETVYVTGKWQLHPPCSAGVLRMFARRIEPPGQTGRAIVSGALNSGGFSEESPAKAFDRLSVQLADSRL